MSENPEFMVGADVKNGKPELASIQIGNTNFRLNPKASIDENKCLFLSYQIMKLAGAENIDKYTVADKAAAAPAPAAQGDGAEAAPAQGDGAPAPAAQGDGAPAPAAKDGEKVSVVEAATAAAQSASKKAIIEPRLDVGKGADTTGQVKLTRITTAAEAVKAAAAAADFTTLLEKLQALLNAVKQLLPVTEKGPAEGGAPMQNLMQRIVDNKPNMTSMYPVKVTRRYRTNRRNRKTNRRRRKSYSRR
jgi:hypothetical protein